MNLTKKDRKYIWHPFTQEKTASLPLPIVKAKGSYLYDEKGKKYLDLVSSWWVNLHGHAHLKISKAIYHQACILEHVIFAGFTHSPAITLCEKLSKILPPHLSRFFFSDDGSTAIEIALKIAYQFWVNQNQDKRKKFLSFHGGYHGDTFGAMAVGKTSGFHDTFKSLFFPVYTIPFPHTWINDKDVEEKEFFALKALDKYLEKHGSTTACFILEPLVQAASGMRLCRPTFLDQCIKKLRAYHILIIFDEIMTGFGRTGHNFAMDILQEKPDILCLSKGLTGGFLPLALTIVKEEIYTRFLSDDFTKALSHGHSYTANPLGCAAACASLDILLTTKTKKNIKQIEKVHEEEISKLLDNKKVKNPRFLGTIAAWNTKDAKKLKQQALKNGLIIRPLNDNVYLLPPYCTPIKTLQQAYSNLISLID